jgi:hypothetical protein
MLLFILPEIRGSDPKPLLLSLRYLTHFNLIWKIFLLLLGARTPPGSLTQPLPCYHINPFSSLVIGINAYLLMLRGPRVNDFRIS